MDFATFMEYAVSGIFIAFCLFAIGKAVHIKVKHSNNINELINYLMDDPEIGKYINNCIQEINPDAKEYDTLEDLINDVSRKLYNYIFNVITSRVSLPDKLIKLLTYDNVVEAVDTLMEHYGIYDKLEDMMNDLIFGEVDALEDEVSSTPIEGETSEPIEGEESGPIVSEPEQEETPEEPKQEEPKEEVPEEKPEKEEDKKPLPGRPGRNDMVASVEEEVVPAEQEVAVASLEEEPTTEEDPTEGTTGDPDAGVATMELL